MQQKHDISCVINYLISYNERFSFNGDFHLFHGWIHEGADLHKDIMPAIEEVTQRNKNITSVSYFGPAVFRKRDNRLELEKAQAKAKADREARRAFTTQQWWKPGGAAPESSRPKLSAEEGRAHNIACKLRLGTALFKVSDEDKAFLAAYEAQYGEVKL